MSFRYRVVLALLILSNITTLMLFLVRVRQDDMLVNPYPYIDFSRNYIAQKNFIVNTQPLREQLLEIYSKYGTNKMAVYIEFLNTGANIAYNPDSRFFPASLIKMPYVIAAVKKVEDGEWKWDDELTMYADDVDVEFGELGNKPIGTKFTIESLVKEILINSDNSAYKILLRNLGQEPISRFLADTGLNNFFDEDRNINAKEYTRLIRSLYSASYLSKENSQKILEWLGESKKNYTGQAIPDGVKFSHKFGENIPKKIYSDSGIVYLKDRPYIITVLYQADNKDTDETINTFFKEVGEVTYNYYKDYNN